MITDAIELSLIWLSQNVHSILGNLKPALPRPFSFPYFLSIPRMFMLIGPIGIMHELCVLAMSSNGSNDVVNALEIEAHQCYPKNSAYVCCEWTWLRPTQPWFPLFRDLLLLRSICSHNRSRWALIKSLLYLYFAESHYCCDSSFDISSENCSVSVLQPDFNTFDSTH